MQWTETNPSLIVNYWTSCQRKYLCFKHFIGLKTMLTDPGVLFVCLFLSLISGFVN